ncbi:MAG: DUF922 domain-containing protein [Notoacmeibacter sp.]|nr:DUF922 domain-containing protein [Notoacmeibacter sp.]
MKNRLILLALAAFLSSPAPAAEMAKRYSYFSVRGTTLEEIEKELDRRGPKVKSTGSRHPGATEMEFRTRLKYRDKGDICEIASAEVALDVRMILPRWRRSARASRETAIIWDTLASDIKRHEESHVVIARNHAMELEMALKKLKSRRGCDDLQNRVAAETDRILSRHDAAQERFDRIEGINFERRMIRLLRYRIERIEDGRL